MMRWWLTLGDFQDTCGRIVELIFDGSTVTTREVLCYRPTPDRAVFGKGFTSGCVAGDVVYVCGFNELYRLSTLKPHVEVVLSRDDFNDLHHVTVHDDQFWLVNTGFDRVDVFAMHGGFQGGFALTPAQEDRLRTHTPLPDDPYFSGEHQDNPLHLRRLADRIHPNHIAFFGGRALVTRFAERSIQDLSTMRVVFEAPGHPHDGCVRGDVLWMTCTNGLLLGCRWSSDRTGLEEVERLDVFAGTGRWGWCRGLWVGPELILVGLTRIVRMPRHRWCDRPFEGTRTSVLLLDRHTGSLLAEAQLGDFGIHPKLFSILEINRD